MPVCLCLFSGLPASGKTTAARRLVSLSKDFSTHHINYDDFVDPKTSYRAFRMKMLVKIEEFIEQYKIRENPVVLIVDDNMIYRSMRKEVHSLSRKHRLGYFQVWFRISLEMALERNRNRSNALPDDTVTNLSSSIEDPSRDLNVETLIIDVNENQSLNLEEFQEKVGHHLNYRETSPEPPRERKERVEPSDLHKIDLILRQEITRRVREAPSRESVKELSETLNAKRKSALKSLRLSTQMPESIDAVRNLLNRDCTKSSIE